MAGPFLMANQMLPIKSIVVMKKLFLLLSLFVILQTLSAQAPSSFRYQAVARDAGGVVITGNIEIRFSLLEDDASGVARYMETHSALTNVQGVFELSVGNGNIISGNLEMVDWGHHQYWLKVEMKTPGANDFTAMGASQLLSVPYAMYAKESGDQLIQGSGISINNGVISNVGDLSANNELQNLSVNGNQLSISNGNSVTLPTGTTYTEGAGIDINGNAISALDISPTNEMQMLSVNGNQLNITGGNSVTLPTGTTYTEGAGIDINGNAISALDVSPTNEIQTLSLNGQQLSLSNGGGSVQLPGGTSSWVTNGITTYNTPITNNVGIGTTSSPMAKLDVVASGTLMAGSFTSPGAADALHTYCNGTGAGIIAGSLNGTGGSFTTQTGTAGYFSSASGKGLIVESGRVGIGTDSPNADLEVLDGNFRVTGPEGSSLNIMTAYGHGSGRCYYGLQYGTGSVGVFASNGGYGLELVDLENGGLGTGLYFESNMTHWNQYVDAAKDMNFANNGTLRAWILDTDGSYHNSSDSRLKKDIRPFRNVLSRLTQLQAYTYHMKDASDDSPLSFGFMAQEVEQQFPDMVVEKDGYKSLCYDHFAVLSVQAIKEQQEEINQQQSLIASQQVQLDTQATALQSMRDELAQLKLLVLQVAEKK